MWGPFFVPFREQCDLVASFLMFHGYEFSNMQLLVVVVVNGCLVCVRGSLTIRTQGEKRWILSQRRSLGIIGNSTSLNGNGRPTALSQKLVAWEALFVLPPRHALFGYFL